MKRFTKTAGILAGIMAVLGISFLGMAFVIGLTPTRFMAMFENGEFRFKITDNQLVYLKDHEVEYDEIEEGVSNIELEFPAGNLEICYGDVRDIQLEYKNAGPIGWTCDEENLHIWKDVVFEDNSDVWLKIILPKNTTYEKITLDIGASLAKIEDIIAEEIHISVGAGQAEIKNLQTEKADFEVGVGKMDVQNITAQDFDFEVGMGQMDVEVCGKESDYDYEVECGIGSVKIGDTSYSGIGTEHHSDKHGNGHHETDNENTNCKMDIDCGIG